jgi:hypothetical protein
MTTAVPIFVMGAPHSGTTILYRMLAMHPDVTWFSQLSCRAGSIPGRRRIPMVSLIEPLLRRRPHWWMKAQTRWSEYYLPLPSGAMGIFEYLLPERATISNDESAARMRRIFDAECRRWRKGTIVLKHPRLCQKVPEIRYAYPTAPFIHIIRDGRAVALSIRWKFMRRGESSIQGLAGAARAWLDTLAALEPEAAAGRSFDVRYEDFCLDVRGTVGRALEFAGLDPERFPYARIPASLVPTNDRWLKAAAPEELALLELLLGYRLSAWGYRVRLAG